MDRAYIEPFGMNRDDVVAIQLHQSHDGKGNGKKTTAKIRKEWINEELKSTLEDIKAEYVIITDSEYFKTLTELPKAVPYLGYVVASPYGNWNCIYVPNYEAIFYNPDKIKAQISMGLRALFDHASGTYIDPGINIIDNAYYLHTVVEIKEWLEILLKQDIPLTCDIEGFGLKFWKTGIGTITFCWNQGEGIAFPVDLHFSPEESQEVRRLLLDFFMRNKNKLIFHHISFDVTVLIYQLFMDHILDTEGLLLGLRIMLREWDDTKLISYLATNSCAGNKLGLKDQAQEFAGNYAVEDLKDIRVIPLPELLQYNLVDGLSTWYVYNKHYPTVIADDQVDIYNNIFKPAIVDIIQMQLTGMPLDMPRVLGVKEILLKISQNAIDRLQSNKHVQEFNYIRLEDYVNKKNNEWKVKRTTISEIQELAKTNENIRDDITLNPNSSDQLAKLLHEILGFPVIDTTETGQPKTGGDTLKALKNHTTDQTIIDLLDALIDYKAVDIIINTFIPAFEDAQQGPDGWYYLFGNFNLGGTLSGRLSSSGPNLQNLPSNVYMIISDALVVYLLEQGLDIRPFVKKGSLSLGKLIKSCFKAPPGWFFGGIDFASLEDRISALTTKDPNKLKVYTDGYDGHSLRAHAYFGDNMPDIDPDSVESINSIQTVYKDYRQDSKVPTFSLTYDGTFITLMKKCGFSKEKAQMIYERFHQFYGVSDEWVKAKLDKASIDGFAICAFGLRVRTPLLAQVVRGTKKTPYEATAEGRSVGNALGQSWCLLNNRASSEFMGKVRESEYRLDIRPCAHIHDAQYYLFRDNIDVIMYANEHLINAVKWQDHPDIWHDEVKLGGELSIFYPDWAHEMGIANDATESEILEGFQKHLSEL